jgi:NADH-quinone oxidoreductase subunit J
MMLDINFSELREGFLNYLPVGGLIGLILVVELLMVLGGWAFSPEASMAIAVPTPPVDQVTNTEALGQIIYTRYFYLFQAAGLVLLVAMIGAIVLTLRQREGVKKQRIGRQVARKREEAIEVRDVPTGSGI